MTKNTRGRFPERGRRPLFFCALFRENTSELQKQVNRLRRRGIPIASDRSGYFYAQTAGEAYATIRQLRKMANGLEAAIQGMEQSLDDFPVGR